MYLYIKSHWEENNREFKIFFVTSHQQKARGGHITQQRNMDNYVAIEFHQNSRSFRGTFLMAKMLSKNVS